MIKADNDLTMRDLKHRGEKAPNFWDTDNGTVVLGLIVGAVTWILHLAHVIE